MASPLDKPLAKVALILIRVLGKSVTLKFVDTAYEPYSGDEDKKPTEYSVKITPPAPFNFAEIDGSSILKGDVRFLLAAKSLPDDVVFTGQNWSVFFRSTTFKIVAASPIYSGEDIAAYDVQARS